MNMHIDLAASRANLAMSQANTCAQVFGLMNSRHTGHTVLAIAIGWLKTHPKPNC